MITGFNELYEEVFGGEVPNCLKVLPSMAPLENVNELFLGKVVKVAVAREHEKHLVYHVKTGAERPGSIVCCSEHKFPRAAAKVMILCAFLFATTGNVDACKAFKKELMA